MSEAVQRIDWDVVAQQGEGVFIKPEDTDEAFRVADHEILERKQDALAETYRNALN